MRTIPLANFVKNTIVDLKKFEVEYARKNEIDPENYPLEIPKNNSGLWMEFFINYLESGEV